MKYARWLVSILLGIVLLAWLSLDAPKKAYANCRCNGVAAPRCSCSGGVPLQTRRRVVEEVVEEPVMVRRKVATVVEEPVCAKAVRAPITPVRTVVAARAAARAAARDARLAARAPTVAVRYVAVVDEAPVQTRRRAAACDDTCPDSGDGEQPLPPLSNRRGPI